MRRFGHDNCLETPEGLIARYQRHLIRRARLSIDGVEPRRKQSKPERKKDEVQRQLLDWHVTLASPLKVLCS